MASRSVLVTGASGLIGRHLLRLLQQHGTPYVASSRHPPAPVAASRTWIPWDLRDWKTPAELDEMFPAVSAVVHAGALVPKVLGHETLPDVFDINVRATLALAQWASSRGIPLIHISSATVYSDPLQRGIREDDPMAASGTGAFGFYGSSKVLAEEAIRSMATQKARFCVLRPSSVFGCGLSENKMIPRLLLRAAAGETIELAPPVDDRVDLIHAKEVAEAILACHDKEACGTFNIASERPVTILEIAQACVAAVGRGAVTVSRAAPSRPPQTRFALSAAAAHTAFGWSSRMSLSDGCRLMWNDMQARFGDA